MKEKINALLIEAMKEKNAIVRTVCRYLNSLIKKKEIDTRTICSDADIISIIKKEIKNNEETLALCKDNNQETFETFKQWNSILNSLLPEQLSEEEVRKRVNNMLSISHFPNMGCAMKAILGTDLATIADKSLIAKIVKEKFNAK